MTNPTEYIEEQDSKPAYFAIIPANVRYCKELPPCARLLYGEITALANKYGYCWAKNEYFADLYEVDVRTVKNWLEDLIRLQFIFVDSKKEGFLWKRKIWISKESQENFTKGKKIPLEGKKTPPRRENNVPSAHIDSNNTSPIENNNNTAAPPDVVVLSFSDKEREQLNNYTPEQIKEATETTNRDCVQKANHSRVKFFFKVLQGLSNKKKKPTSVYDELKKHFQNGNLYREAICDLTTQGIGFTRGMKHDQIEINKFWSWDKFKAMCEDFGIKFTRT